MKIQWKNIKIGTEFEDGSVVTQIHEKHIYTSIKLIYKKFISYSITVSEDHYFLCDILDEDVKERIFSLFENVTMPKSCDCHCFLPEKYFNDEIKTQIENYLTKGIEIDNKIFNFIQTKLTYTETHSVIENDKIWLSAKNIHWLISNNIKVKSGKCLFTKAWYVGDKEVRCVSTNSCRYTSNGLIHHNSVTLRNIIFHCLTHNYDWGVGLVDLKLTEFTPFKGINGIVAVANTVPETVELLRVAREIMYKRNKLLAELGLTDIADYKPSKPTGKIWVSGRELDENQILQVKINGEEKQITAKELLELTEGEN